MATWRRTDPGAVPEQLARFVAAEWPGGVDEWRDTCLQWLQEDAGRQLPFGEYGDSLDLIRESARIKIEAAGLAG